MAAATCAYVSVSHIALLWCRVRRQVEARRLTRWTRQLPGYE